MKYILPLLLLFASLGLQAQESTTYSKVRIDLTNHEISELGVLGLEIDHGAYHRGKHFVSILSENEIAEVKAAGIPYKVEIADATEHYLRTVAESAHGHDHGPSTARVNECNSSGGAPIYDYDTPENYTNGSMGGYLTMDEYLTVLDDMSSKYPNLITQKQPIGNLQTEEGRSIYWLKISDNPNMDEDEPEVLYNALHHAREPNSMSQLIFFMWYVLENYETDPEIKFLLDNTELYFIPMVNPDGYAYNQSTDPNGGGFWRKNRWKDSNGEAFGVDLNRNYGFEWAYDNQGSSPNPGSGTFRGLSAFSEPETQAVKMLCEAHNFQLALNYHTFGNLLIHPWGFSDMPTAEDESFKTMGRFLNIENNYKLGTGTETVGYTVNGDSDDYMYGEQVDKNKIYSYTPEVGPGFWPQPSEIDNLNKSNVRMNINLGLLTHNTLIAIDESPLLYTGYDNQLNIKLKQAGLASGTNTVTVTSSDPNVISIGPPITTNFEHLEEEVFNIDFSIAPTVTTTIDVTFTITIDNGQLSQSQEIKKSIAQGSPTILVLDEISNDENFNANDNWGITNEEFVSAPTSYTDSPGSDYTSNRNDHVLFTEPIDLSEAVSATLNYKAQWDIEDDFDFVQVLVGTQPNINLMTAQCGIFTNPGSSDQIEGAPLYDGTQAEWVAEKISLADFLGEENVYFGFRFISDGFVNGDGFYFDDLELEIILDTDTDTDNFVFSNAISIAPNPTKDNFSIVFDEALTESSTMSFQLIDVSGRIVLQNDLNERKTIDINHLSNGVYQLILMAGDRKLAIKKVVKI